MAAGAPPDRLIFHGNNKSTHELSMAVEAGVGRIVIDSMAEIDRIEAIVQGSVRPPDVSIRVNPGVEAHTHDYLQTGVADSKFGISIEGGRAEEAVRRVDGSSSMNLVGIHAHVGSQVFEVESFGRAVRTLGEFVSPLGVEELSVGGGLGVPYVASESAPSITAWGELVHQAAREAGITSIPRRAAARRCREEAWASVSTRHANAQQPGNGSGPPGD